MLLQRSLSRAAYGVCLNRILGHRLVFSSLLSVLLCLCAGAPAQVEASAPRPQVVANLPVERFRSLTQPTFTTCGQTSVAMVTGLDVKSVINVMGTKGRTNAGQLIDALHRLQPGSAPKVVALNGSDPARNSIVFLKDPTFGDGHWTVFHDGKYYDPIYGKLSGYPSWIQKRFAICVN